MINWRTNSKNKRLVDPDEIFLDARNLPSFDQEQFEGQIEQPIAKQAIYWVGLIFLLISLGFIWRVGVIQIGQGEVLAARSDSNRLRHTVIFPDRGPIVDRVGEILAWSDNGRHYMNQIGLAHVIGFLGLPNKAELDSGQYHTQELIGKDGVERSFNELLAGRLGRKIEEVDAHDTVYSDYLLQAPETGGRLELAIDSRLQEAFHQAITQVAADQDFSGGAGVIMDITTGELLALVSYPEYDPRLLVNNRDSEAISQYLVDERLPFFNRAISGLYAPGSVVKPMVAAGVLAEDLIDPTATILSTGSLIVPNPYYPDQPSVFRDWRAHGVVDMRRALAVSSNIYFYQVGGGFGDQLGLGISRLEEYFRWFGFGQPTGIDLVGEESGVIPSPAWKAKNFAGDIWRLGDTYHTSIGQFGMQVTPLQVTRAMAIIAGGEKVTPTIRRTVKPEIESLAWPVTDRELEIVREGLRQAVTEGTAQILNVPYVTVAGKTGTAEIGTAKRYVNSWMTGFFPYEDPRWAFTVVMERGPQANQIGGGVVFRRLLDWMREHTPEYFADDELIQ